MRLEACALEGRAGWAESLHSLVPQPVVGSNSGTGAQEPSPTRAAPTRACSRTRPQAAVGASHQPGHSSVSVCLLFPPTTLPNAARIQTKETRFVLLGERGKHVVPSPCAMDRPERGPERATRGGALIVREGPRRRASLSRDAVVPVSPCVLRATRAYSGGSWLQSFRARRGLVQVVLRVGADAGGEDRRAP